MSQLTRYALYPDGLGLAQDGAYVLYSEAVIDQEEAAINLRLLVRKSAEAGLLRAALLEIASHDGRTMGRHKDSARLPDSADKCYSKGAADAYKHLAKIARDAIAKATP